MKHKVSELTGAMLDAAVAQALGWLVVEDAFWGSAWRDAAGKDVGTKPASAFHPSTEWIHGGPIIEREGLDLEFHDELLHGTSERWWEAYRRSTDGSGSKCFTGPTPLIAAMRAFVEDRFGDEVDLP